MAIYRVFQAPGAEADKAIFVREGFSTAAMAFSVLWVLWNRMWVVAAVLLAISAAISVAGYALGTEQPVLPLLGLAVAVLVGFEAERLKAWSLVRAGYRESAIVAGGSLDEAELHHFITSPGAPAVAASDPVKRSGGDTHDTLGLFGTA